MRHLRNTLFVLTPDSYLALDGENVVVLQEEQQLGRIPLHTLEHIHCFTYKGGSPALLGACAQRGISFCFFTPNGRFLARTSGPIRGNVLLRKQQYRISDDEAASAEIAKSFLIGKIYNARWVLERTARDHALRVDVAALKDASAGLAVALKAISESDSLENLRGLEGEAASRYFGVFSELILQNQAEFMFSGRSRRPPLDNVNALLSFLYALIANECTSALEGAGLDPYVGFLHRDKPGRASLALDLMEELRAVLGDRFAVSLINNRVVKGKHFLQKENGAVFLTDDGRKAVLHAYQEKKKEIITHPFLKEKLPWGLVAHMQALLLARYLRGDLDAYPPFLWK